MLGEGGHENTRRSDSNRLSQVAAQGGRGQVLVLSNRHCLLGRLTAIMAKQVLLG